MTRSETVARILEKLAALRPSQLTRIERMVDALAEGGSFTPDPESDLASTEFCEEFGDALRQHHNLSSEPFTKDKFEFAMVSVLNDIGVSAEKSPTGNPGHDLTVERVPWSLKTQANRALKNGFLHISKFMELGRGSWTESQADLVALRQQMFEHMKAYERIFTLRCLARSAGDGGTNYEYELVEIPKSLLKEADGLRIEVDHNSKQNPKPAFCRVIDAASGSVRFELYFDGGTERKLQVRNIDKRLCTVHATWSFMARS